MLPHAVFHEMLFFFTAEIPGTGSEPETAIVTREIADRYKMTDEVLLKAAVSASKERSPAVIHPLSAFLDKLAGEFPDAGRRVPRLSGSSSGSSFFVLTNPAARFGAAVILYPGITEELFRRFGPYYLLPSSVHEILILPEKDSESPAELKQLIRSSNRCLGDSLLILSDDLYRYDPEGGLRIC